MPIDLKPRRGTPPQYYPEEIYLWALFAVTLVVMDGASFYYLWSQFEGS